MSLVPRSLAAAAVLATALLPDGCSNPAPSLGKAGQVQGGESVRVVDDCVIPSLTSTASVNLATDIIYAGMGGQNQRLDIAWPKRPGPHPLVILIHGGGWSGGDKSGYRNEMLLLASQGYVAASVNYRLAAAPRNVFPAAVEDVRCAVRWLRAHASTYGIDPERVAALGSSAGGHLASMLGTAADVPGLDGACPLREVSAAVNAVVALAGPHDIRAVQLLGYDQRATLENFLGVSPEADPMRALLASPGVHASAGDPPFLLVHGTEDNVVPIRQSRFMRDALRAAGVSATLIELRGVGHSFPEFSKEPRFRASSCTILAFLREQLRPGI